MPPNDAVPTTVNDTEPCPSEFCQCFNNLDLDVKSADFASRLCDEIKGWMSTREIPKSRWDLGFLYLYIGSRRELEQRSGCVSCRFFNEMLQNADSRIVPEDTRYYAVFFEESNIVFHLRYEETSNEPDDSGSDVKPGIVHNVITFLCDTPLHAKAGRKIDYSWPDMARVREWIQQCDKYHSEECTETAPILPQRQLPPSLRVFDVEKFALVEIPWHEKYVTLSYVWGNAEPPRLWKNVLHKYMKPYALKDSMDTFPPTIQDMITVVRKLGLRYFWFDALCLVQDDPVDLNMGIKNMDVVYERSYLTIIAASGPSANEQISGVSKSRDKYQHIGRIKPGLDMVELTTLPNPAVTSKWGTRGWTLQEEHLSSRKLIFANGHVYFSCRKSIWTEDSWSDCWPEDQHELSRKGEVSLEGDWGFLAHRKGFIKVRDSPLAFLKFIKTAIETFQGRNLTEDGDAVNAMTGLLQRINQHISSEIIHGQITAILPLLLLFRNRNVMNKSIPIEAVPRRRYDFPSWSWAGWDSRATGFCFLDWQERGGPGKKHQRLSKWLRKSNWIYWYASQQGAEPRLVHDPHGGGKFVDNLADQAAQKLPPASGMWAFLAKCARLVKGVWATIVSATLFNMRKRPEVVPDEKEIERGNFLRVILPRCNLAEYPRRPAGPAPDKNYTILMFHTIMIRLRVVPSELDYFHVMDLQDRSGSRCGRVAVDLLSSGYNSLVSCIVLAERPGPFLDKCHELTWDIGWAFGDKMLWIMLVEWVNDVYERRGIGVVRADTVANSLDPGPEWKEILLG